MMPCPTISSLITQTVAHSQQSVGQHGSRNNGTVSSHSQQRDEGLLVSLSGVVLATSTPWFQRHSCAWRCEKCYTDTQTLEGQDIPRSCCAAAAESSYSSDGGKDCVAEEMSKR